MTNKYKILVLSDHALSTSGVGCQSRFLLEGLIQKGRWSVRQLGAAIKHSDYSVVHVNSDFIIKPIDGFGNREMIMQILATERPDVILLFTDPRFFIWFYEMEDEIRQVCPVAYWHVWDNYPFPTFNLPIYEATDLINCHSHMTYEMVSEHFPKKTNFIPHALPDEIFYPIKEEEIKNHKSQLMGDKSKDKFVLFWVNRNARRKRPADLMWAWSIFMNKLKEEGKENDAILLLHTDPHDQEGPNLLALADHFQIHSSCYFSNQRIDFDKMNILHNISDACINISYAEGFGLATLEAMKCGKPIIAVKTGGLTRQVVDHRDGSENGIALEVDSQTLVGSQNVPFIWEDYASINDISDAIYKMYSMGKEERKKIGKKAREYVQAEFALQDTVDKWDQTLVKLVEDHKKSPVKRWICKELKGD
jgi:glycosyltransferase involved in cell wall biosynthesis